MRVALNDALLIPQKATFEVLEKKYVFVIDEEDRVQAREIEIASELPHIYAISDGLKEDDKILLDGLRLVRANDQIEFDFVEPSTALAGLELYAE
jgi:membrane fusion protein (multidrug efflux system)